MSIWCYFGMHRWRKVKMLSSYQVADKVCERCGLRKVFYGWGWVYKNGKTKE